MGIHLRAPGRHLPYGISDYTVLPATRHKWTCPAITPANQAGIRFTYPGRLEGWVVLGSLIAAWPEIEPTTAWSQVRYLNRYATKPPTTYEIAHVEKNNQRKHTLKKYDRRRENSRQITDVGYLGLSSLTFNSTSMRGLVSQLSQV